jgi:hypothetical protein
MDHWYPETMARKYKPKTPGSGVKRAKRHHFQRDGVKTPTTALRIYFKHKVEKNGCGLCGTPLVGPDGILSHRARLDHCHRAEAPNGVGFLRGYLCASCNALEGYYKWTKVGTNADSLLASAVRRKHGVDCTTDDVCAFRQGLSKAVKKLF